MLEAWADFLLYLEKSRTNKAKEDEEKEKNEQQPTKAKQPGED
jgi:hypothetical protein